MVGSTLFVIVQHTSGTGNMWRSTLKHPSHTSFTRASGSPSPCFQSCYHSSAHRRPMTPVHRNILVQHCCARTQSTTGVWALSQRGVFDGLGIQGQGQGEQGVEEDKKSGTMTGRVGMNFESMWQHGYTTTKTLHHPPDNNTLSTTRAR